MTACSQNENSKNQINENKMKSKTLIVYFSATGTTESVAKQLADILKADLQKIEPLHPYTADDLDWTNRKSRTSIEMNDKQFRPTIGNKIDNIDDYDKIYVGYPIWWYTAPTIINTFLESYDFKKIKIIPFATSGSSDIEKSCKELKDRYPNINWGKGKLLNNVSKKDIEEWIFNEK